MSNEDINKIADTVVRKIRFEAWAVAIGFAVYFIGQNWRWW